MLSLSVVLFFYFKISIILSILKKSTRSSTRLFRILLNIPQTLRNSFLGVRWEKGGWAHFFCA